MKYRLSSLLILASSFLITSPVLADETNDPIFGSGAGGPNSGSSGGGFVTNPLAGRADSLTELLSVILDAVVRIGVLYVALSIIWVGFKFVQAQGKPEEIKEAKKSFLWTIIGAAVVLGAFVISNVIQGTVTPLVGTTG